MKQVSPILNEYREILDQDEFEQLVKDLIDSFIELSPKQLDQLKSASKTSDNDAFKRAAHTLKSSGDIFGFTAFRSMAVELEMMGCAANSTVTEHLVIKLEIEYVKVKTILLELRESIE